MVLRNKREYPQICLDFLAYMEDNLPEHLTYHCLNHIIDVANVCDDYIKYYDIKDENAKLIRIAAISHDLGFVASPQEHEERSIEEIRPFLEQVLDSEEIEKVNGMIRATKVPQNPQNFLEEILADADLDYLGRGDYDKLSSGLYQELMHYNLIKSEEQWLDIQINFLEKHRYHTSFAKENRSHHKLEKLKELKLKKEAHYH